MSAIEAFTTARGKWRDYVVANFEFFDFRSDFVHVAGEFVAHDEVGTRFLVAAVDMEFTGDMTVRFDLFGRSCLTGIVAMYLPHSAV
jgi:hypothetical protein